MKTVLNMLLALWSLLIISCAELPVGQTPTDSVPPPPLASVDVTPLPGGAEVKYKLPDDPDISYVKCEYISNNVTKVVRSSVYQEYLTIEGLGSTEAIEISLTVVDHSENSSTVVKKTFVPETPPIFKVFETLKLFPGIGGVKAVWTNELGIEIGLTVFVEENTVMKEGETKFLTDIDGEYIFKGMRPKECKYGVNLRDKWGNTTELKEATFSVMYETFLDKTKFREGALPQDNTTVSSSRPLSFAFDNIYNNLWHTDGNQNPQGFPEGCYCRNAPHMVTIDLGLLVRLTRYKVHGRKQGGNGMRWFMGNSFRKFELWGTNELKGSLVDNVYWSANGGWKNDWVMLNDIEIIRPSGRNEDGQENMTPEDIAAGIDGFEFFVPDELLNMQIRYVRFFVKTTWANQDPNGIGQTDLHMTEFDFWGDDGTAGEGTVEDKPSGTI